MSKQVFVADTILTASEMNTLQGNDYNQTVSTKTASYTLVAADKGTKIVMNSASATTITVNTSLFSAGDTLTILNIAAGVCTVTAGTATVSTTGSLALAQYGGGTLYFTSAGVSVFQADGVTAGMTCVKAQTTFTASSSITADNIFTSTYANYLVLFTFDASGAINLNMRLRVGGVDNSTAASYARQSIEVDNTTVTGFRGTSAEFLLGGGSTTGPSTVALNLFQPAVADETLFQCNNQKQVTNPILFLNYAFHNQSTAYDGFNIFPASGTITGYYAVYGYSKAV